MHPTVQRHTPREIRGHEIAHRILQMPYVLEAASLLSSFPEAEFSVLCLKSAVIFSINYRVKYIGQLI